MLEERLFWGCYNGQVTKIRSYQTHTRKQNNKKQKNKTAETENSCSIAESTWGKPISICEDKVELDHNHFKLSFASSRTNTTLTEKILLLKAEAEREILSGYLGNQVYYIYGELSFWGYIRITQKACSCYFTRDSGSGVVWKTLRF